MVGVDMAGRLLARVVVALIVYVSLLPLPGSVKIASAHPHQTQAALESTQLLDHLARDYGEGVKDGSIISRTEFDEHAMFATRVRELIERDFSGAEHDELRRDAQLVERLASSGAPEQEVEEKAQSLRSKIAAHAALAAPEQQSQVAWLTGLGAFTLLIREGIEAILIAVLLLALLRKSGGERLCRFVHAGWICAVLFGVVLWFATGRLIELSGFGSEVVEGVASLLAVVVLLYVGFWLHRQVAVGERKSGFEVSVSKALQKPGRFAAIGLFLASFLAIFRESIETVLFLRTLVSQAGPSGDTAVFAGVFGGIVAIAGIAIAMTKLSVRMPFRQFFRFSTVVMGVLAVVLVGKGVHAFQEIGWIAETKFAIVPRIESLGLFPYVQTLLAQFIVAVLVWQVLRSGRRVAARDIQLSKASFTPQNQDQAPGSGKVNAG